MRAFVAVMSLIVLAGCAAPQAKTQSARAPEGPIALGTRDFLDYVTDETNSRLTDVCGAVPTAQQAACFRENLLASFEDTGGARGGCFEGNPDGDRYKCVLLGAFSYSMARSAKLGAVNHFDWGDPEGQFERVLREMANKASARCGSAACEAKEMATLLSLSEKQSKSCVALSASRQRFDCVMHTHILQMIETGLGRMGAAQPL